MPSDLSVVNADGESQTVGEVLSKKSIVIFYCGEWCPYGIRHLSALHKVKDEIADLGYDLVTITPDQFDSLGVSESKAQTDITIYSASDADVIEAFGLGWKID